MDLHEMLDMESELRKIAQKITTEWKCHVGGKFTRTEVLVMYRLMTEGRQRASRLADGLSITTGGLTGITDRLVKGEYIERKRDTEDRRVVYLSIADKGKEEIYKMRDARDAFVQKVFKDFSNVELAQLKQVAGKLLENLANMEQSPPDSCNSHKK